MYGARFPPLPPPLSGAAAGSADADAVPILDAAAAAHHLAYLTSIRNAVIGSRTKKEALAQHGDISYFVSLLNTPLHAQHALDIRSQAATILGSIAHGASITTLLVLLRARTPQNLLRAVVDLLSASSAATASHQAPALILTAPSDAPLKSLESIIRALRIIILSLADEIAASPRWGVGSEWGTKGGALSASAVPAGVKLHDSTHFRHLSGALDAAASDRDGDPDDNLRQVRLLGRAAIATCFEQAHLPLLLAPLMLIPSDSSRLAQGSSAQEAYGPSTSAPVASSSRERGVPVSSSASASTTHMFPSSTKVRLNNITEMVCSLLSACLAIPGPRPQASTATGPFILQFLSPGGGIATRRDALLSFRARHAPWAETQLKDDPEQARPSHRAQTRASGPTRMQAELLHSPSRSGSLDREQDRRARERGAGLFQANDDPIARNIHGGGRSSSIERSAQGIVNAGAAYPGALLQSRAPDASLLDVLIEAVEGSLAKTREAALWTIAELVRDHPPAAQRFILAPTTFANHHSTTTMTLGFREDASVDLRLAASCCMSNVIKAHKKFGLLTTEYVLAALVELLDPLAPPLSVKPNLASAQSQADAVAVSGANAGTSGSRAASSYLRRPHGTSFDAVRNQLLGVTPPSSSTGRRAGNSGGASIPTAASSSGPPIPIALGGPHEIDVQVQACFALSRLLRDDVELQLVAHERYDIVRRVAGLVEASWKEVRRRLDDYESEKAAFDQSSSMPRPGAPPPMLVAASGGRLLQNAALMPALSEGVIRLLEASLTALATIAFHADEIRLALIESAQPALLPILTPCLVSPALGVRIAACRLVRALSRSVAALRTSLVDAGVGPKLIALLHDERESEEVQLEVVATLCNMVLKHSPMHALVLSSGSIERLVSFLGDGRAENGEEGSNSIAMNVDAEHGVSQGPSAPYNPAQGSTGTRGPMVINVLWALRNLLCRASIEVKRKVGAALGWERLLALCNDTDVLIQEQALNLVRNLAADNEMDIEMTVSELGLDRLLDALENVIWERRGGAAGGRTGVLVRDGDNGGEGDELALIQAAHVLVNLATGSRAVRMGLLQRPNLLDAILFFVTHPREEIRIAGVWCATNLTDRMQPAFGHTSSATDLNDDVSTEAVKRLRAFNLDTRVRSLLEREEALNVRDRAQALLLAFETPA